MFGLMNNPRGRGLGVDPRWVSVTFFLAKRLSTTEMKYNHETQDLDKMATFLQSINSSLLSLPCFYFRSRCLLLSGGEGL